MKLEAPYKALPPAAVHAVAMAEPNFLSVVVHPWLQELAEHHKRFRVPPFLSTAGGLPIIDVQGTRWMTPYSPPDILYIAAVDAAVPIPAKDDDRNIVKVWAPTPVPLPARLEQMAQVIE